MALSVTWETGVIFVPQSYLQLVGGSVYQLDTNQFRLDLRDLEDDVAEGMLYPNTHNHVQPITVGGVDLARVIEIINGYTVTFEDGQYRVILAGSNNNILDVANVNQVSIAPTNSAGLTYSKQVEDSAFSDARVWIDVDNGMAGTKYPRGTPGDPVNNLADAQSIIAARSLPKRIHLQGNLTLQASDDVSGYNFLGESVQLSSISAITGANTTDLVVQDCQITGDLNGNITARRATSFTNLQDFDGTLHGTGLGGTVTLATGPDAHEFIDCYSEEGGTATPVVDVQGITEPEIYFRRYSGSVDIRNMTSGVMTVGIVEGRAILASSCTGGTIVVRGVCELEDNSGPGCTVVSDGTVTALVNSSGGLTPGQQTQLNNIESKTQPLTYSVPGKVDANIKYVNDVQVSGNGQTGSEWGPA